MNFIFWFNTNILSIWLWCLSSFSSRCWVVNYLQMNCWFCTNSTFIFSCTHFLYIFIYSSAMFRCSQLMFVFSEYFFFLLVYLLLQRRQHSLRRHLQYTKTATNKKYYLLFSLSFSFYCVVCLSIRNVCILLCEHCSVLSADARNCRLDSLAIQF